VADRSVPNGALVSIGAPSVRAVIRLPSICALSRIARHLGIPTPWQIVRFRTVLSIGAPSVRAASV